MSAFDDAKRVEADGLVPVLSYLRSIAFNGQVVQTDKGSLAFELQTMAGDVLFNDSKGNCVSVELKFEQRYTGNFFFEIWSNLDPLYPKVGWTKTLRSDKILYFFLDTYDLYIIDRPKLYTWLYIDGKERLYKTVQQSKYSQLNKTVGLIVPIEDTAEFCKKRVLQRAA
jgi:hypothetical protein